MLHAQSLRQLVAAQAREGLHRLLDVGQLEPRKARALECGRLEVLDARVPWNHSPSTAAAANQPPLVKALAERIIRRIQSRGQATPCVPTQGHIVLPDCPTFQVNAIALKGRQADMNFGSMPLFDMRLAIAHSELRYDLLSEWRRGPATTQSRACFRPRR